MSARFYDVTGVSALALAREPGRTVRRKPLRELPTPEPWPPVLRAVRFFWFVFVLLLLALVVSGGW